MGKKKAKQGRASRGVGAGSPARPPTSGGRTPGRSRSPTELLAPGVATFLATPVRDWPKLETFAQGPIAISRSAVTNQYGKAFATKASDELCQALATVQAFALESTGAAPRPVILEFDSSAPASADVARRAVALNGSSEPPTPGIILLARRHLLRDLFAQRTGGIRAHIEGRTRPMLSAGLEAMASPTTPSSVVESCWLNGTLRTYVDPRNLRDVAAEDTLNRLDLPRLLRAEIDTTARVVGAPQLREASGVSGEHITVAVIDAEVQIDHPALLHRVLQRGNFTKERWGHPSTHGTAVAGIVASVDGKYTGMGPAITIANYKVIATDASLNADDFGGSLAIQQALEDGVQVANLSWGTGPASDGTSREAKACNAAWSLGLVLIKSAGNAGPGGSTLTSPADADGVIVVGATGRDGRAVQDYSSRGPAGNRVRPHLVAPGGSEADPIHSSATGGVCGAVGSGTSFATPHVSGLAALVLAKTPGLTPDQVRDKLLASCTPIPGVAANVQGSGLISLA